MVQKWKDQFGTISGIMDEQSMRHMNDELDIFTELYVFPESMICGKVCWHLDTVCIDWNNHKGY